VVDLTQHYASEGWLYAGVVPDGFPGRAIGWAMGERPITELAVNGLTTAVRNRRPGPGTVHHSEHGAQYTALAFGRTLRAAVCSGPWGALVTPWKTRWPKLLCHQQTELLDRWS